MAGKRKLVVWDIDGPINHGFSNARDEYYLPEDRSENSRPGGFDTDFIVDNKKMLLLTMSILHENNVESVIGSQRIQIEDDDPVFGRFLKAMYRGLDHVFGKNRPFLKEDIARKVGKNIQHSETNKSKNTLLKAYQLEYGVNSEDIILIDDHINYVKSVKEAGHVFIHAPRTKPLGTIDDNAYLYETLLRTVGIDDIYTSIERSTAQAQIKKQYKQQLVDYQQLNLKEVISWQATIIATRGLPIPLTIPESASHEEQSSKQVLKGIQYLIVDTKWELGYFGGVKIIDLATGIKNTVPKGMGKILDQIKLAQDGKQSWNDTTVEIERITTVSSEKKGHGFFNQRGDATQVFYDKVKEMLKEFRKNGSQGMEEPTVIPKPQ